MSEMKHTHEPWLRSQTLVFGDDLLVARCANGNTTNAQRIVDCVNACAGMADPAVEIATLRARVAEFVRYAANDFVHNRDGKTEEYKRLFDESLAEIQSKDPNFDPFVKCLGVRSAQEATVQFIKSQEEQPDTVRGWLKQLPDGYRERALGQCERLNKPCDSIEDFYFWGDVYRHYIYGTPLPPLPEQP